ncbi:MAG TPA: Cof-type HAD-IIB family hydrolase [Fimbriimonadales bacterium]|nr:Cof-type HAD-IIB family hydrolase [Fimbriimonadales bacterium]
MSKNGFAHPIQLLAIDLDFTLLDGNRNIVPENASAIQRLNEAGIKIALASGRIASSMRHFADEMEIEPSLISCNGAYLVAYNGRVLQEHKVKIEYSNEILSFCQKTGVHAHIYADDTIFFAEENEMLYKYMRRVKRGNVRVLDWDALYGIEPLKIIMMISPDEANDIQRELGTRLPADEVQFTLSEPEYLEVLSAKTDKGEALSSLASALGIPQNQTAAIGDYYNDLPMLEWAGHSAAVANAPEEVKKIVDLVVGANDDGGVAAYIDLILASR